MIRRGRFLHHPMLRWSVTAVLLALVGALCWSFSEEGSGAMHAAALCLWGLFAVALVLSSVRPGCFAALLRGARGPGRTRPGRTLGAGGALASALMAGVCLFVLRDPYPLGGGFLVLALGFLGLLLPGPMFAADPAPRSEGETAER